MSASARKNRARPASPARAAKPSAAKSAPRIRNDKLSVSLGSDDVTWVTRRAKRLGTSVSAVVAAAIAEQRRAEARDTLLDMLSGEEVTEAQVAAARREAFGK